MSSVTGMGFSYHENQQVVVQSNQNDDAGYLAPSQKVHSEFSDDTRQVHLPFIAEYVSKPWYDLQCNCSRKLQFIGQTIEYLFKWQAIRRQGFGDDKIERRA
jgi:hypothetical protein